MNTDTYCMVIVRCRCQGWILTETPLQAAPLYDLDDPRGWSVYWTHPDTSWKGTHHCVLWSERMLCAYMWLQHKSTGIWYLVCCGKSWKAAACLEQELTDWQQCYDIAWFWKANNKSRGFASCRRLFYSPWKAVDENSWIQYFVMSNCCTFVTPGCPVAGDMCVWGTSWTHTLAGLSDDLKLTRRNYTVMSWTPKGGSPSFFPTWKSNVRWSPTFVWWRGLICPDRKSSDLYNLSKRRGGSTVQLLVQRVA